MRRNTQQHFMESRTKVKSHGQERIRVQANAVCEDQETTIKLKISATALSFWHEIITDAFEAASVMEDVDTMETLDTINELDELLCELEEIMELSPEGGTIHITINNLNKLLCATEMNKLAYRINKPNNEYRRLAEGNRSELECLAQPFHLQLKALQRVVGIVR